LKELSEGRRRRKKKRKKRKKKARKKKKKKKKKSWDKVMSVQEETPTMMAAGEGRVHEVKTMGVGNAKERDLGSSHGRADPASEGLRLCWLVVRRKRRTKKKKRRMRRRRTHG